MWVMVFFTRVVTITPSRSPYTGSPTSRSSIGRGPFGVSIIVPAGTHSSSITVLYGCGFLRSMSVPKVSHVMRWRSVFSFSRSLRFGPFPRIKVNERSGRHFSTSSGQVRSVTSLGAMTSAGRCASVRADKETELLPSPGIRNRAARGFAWRWATACR